MTKNPAYDGHTERETIRVFFSDEMSGKLKQLTEHGFYQLSYLTDEQNQERVLADAILFVFKTIQDLEICDGRLVLRNTDGGERPLNLFEDFVKLGNCGKQLNSQISLLKIPSLFILEILAKIIDSRLNVSVNQGGIINFALAWRHHVLFPLLREAREERSSAIFIRFKRGDKIVFAPISI